MSQLLVPPQLVALDGLGSWYIRISFMLLKTWLTKSFRRLADIIGGWKLSNGSIKI